MEGRNGGRKRRPHAWPEMASPKLLCSSAGAGGGRPRRGSGAVPLVVVLFFLDVSSPSFVPPGAPAVGAATTPPHGHLSTSFSLPRKTAHPQFLDAMEEQGGVVCVIGMEDQGRLRRTDKGKAQRGRRAHHDQIYPIFPLSVWKFYLI